MLKQKHIDKKTINTHIGKIIRYRRKALGMNQTELGKELGISFQAIQKYENGDHSLTMIRLFEISIALKLPLDKFFDGIQNYSFDGKTKNDPYADPKITEMIYLFNRLDKDKKDSILKLIGG